MPREKFPGMYTVIAKGKAHTDLTFQQALQKITNHFESDVKFGVGVKMYRQGESRQKHIS